MEEAPSIINLNSANEYTVPSICRLRLKCDGTRAETSFRLSAKRTSPFKSAEASVQSTTGSRGVRISGSNAGYTMFRGSVKSRCRCRLSHGFIAPRPLYTGPLCPTCWNSFLPSSPEAIRTHRRERPLLAREGN
jgi:hypothetical protein